MLCLEIILYYAIYHINVISEFVEKKWQFSWKNPFLNAPVLRRCDGLMIYENPGECMHAPNAPSNHLALLSNGRETRSNYFMTLSYCIPFTVPPPIEDRTFRLKPSLFVLRSSAASLLRGSEAFGSRNRN